jgi:hypothetical protein
MINTSNGFVHFHLSLSRVYVPANNIAWLETGILVDFQRLPSKVPNTQWRSLIKQSEDRPLLIERLNQ